MSDSKPRLVVRSSPDSGKIGRTFELGDERFTIGREDDCSLVLRGDGRVSRRHAALEAKERFKGRYRGTIDPESGALSSVRIRGTVGGLDFTGRIGGRVLRHVARGSWSASVDESTGSGDWEAKKQ